MSKTTGLAAYAMLGFGSVYACTGHARTRLLVRLCIDLFVSGGDAYRTARRNGRRHGPVPTVSARADLQGAGLGHLAVQSLSGQGPLPVARPRTAVRGSRPALPAAGTFPAAEPAGGAGCARRLGRRLGRGVLPRGLPDRVQRSQPD